VMGHQWDGFWETAVKEITRAATSEPGAAKWQGPKMFRSPGRDFKLHGYVPFHLPGNFSLLYARKCLRFGLAERWTRLLMYKTVRRHFLTACKRVAHVAGATEILLLSGECLWDSLQEGVDFEELKRRAVQQLGGPPDLDISRFYAKEEVPIMPQDRVHYFLVSASELNGCS